MNARCLLLLRRTHGLTLSLVMLPLLGVAQVTPPPQATEEAAVRAATALLNARTENLKAERELQLALDAPVVAREAAAKAEADAKAAADKEAADKKEQRLKDTLAAITDLAGKLPQGNYTSSTDGVATPQAMDLAYASLDLATTKLETKIRPVTGGMTLIFVDAIPSPNAGYELTMYRRMIEDLITQSQAFLNGPKTTAQVGAAALITSLPGVVNAITGLFRSDVVEKTFDANIASATAASSYMGKFLAAEAEKKGAGRIFLSLEAYALEKPDIPIIEKIIELQNNDNSLAEWLESPPDAKAEEAEVSKASNAVDEISGKIKNLQYRRDLFAEMAKLTSTNPGNFDAQIAALGDQIVALQTALAPLKTSLANAKANLAKKTAKADEAEALRAKIAKVLTAVNNTEGNSPLFVRLIRDSFLETAANQPNLLFVTIAVAAAPQSTINKRNFFSNKTFGSSFVALEYRVATGKLAVVSAGVEKMDFTMKKLNFSKGK